MHSVSVDQTTGTCSLPLNFCSIDWLTDGLTEEVTDYRLHYRMVTFNWRPCSQVHSFSRRRPAMPPSGISCIIYRLPICHTPVSQLEHLSSSACHSVLGMCIKARLSCSTFKRKIPSLSGRLLYSNQARSSQLFCWVIHSVGIVCLFFYTIQYNTIQWYITRTRSRNRIWGDCYLPHVNKDFQCKGKSFGG